MASSERKFPMKQLAIAALPLAFALGACDNTAEETVPEDTMMEDTMTDPAMTDPAMTDETMTDPAMGEDAMIDDPLVDDTDESVQPADEPVADTM